MRHGPPLLFGDSQPQLAIEEYKALAGVWRAELELDGGAAASLACTLRILNCSRWLSRPRQVRQSLREMPNHILLGGAPTLTVTFLLVATPTWMK